MKPRRYGAGSVVNAFDAKTHLSRLLRDVEGGTVVTITKRGRPVARLVPVDDGNEPMSRAELLRRFDAIRRKAGKKVDIRSYILEGRKR